ncbi:MAG: RluA family pseudouridine synthase [Oscillospiraceae bacterium]|nr:RluA family pseudouridine synthase [Oscillospiraceae bacterium]
MENEPIQLLYTDKRIAVCVKPAGVLSTDEPGGVPELVRAALGQPDGCVRTVHRLDRVVGGVMVLARSVRAASELGKQMQDGGFQKEYLAVVHGSPAGEGRMEDLLRRDARERKTYVVSEQGKDVRPASLSYKTIARRDGLALVSIRLHTGRTNQIRCQFASRDLPLVGDRKYGWTEDSCGIALWSHTLSFRHPETGEPMSFACTPPSVCPWDEFETALEELS